MQWTNLKAVLEDFCKDCVGLVRERLVDDGHDATGQLIHSMSYHIEITDDDITAYLDHEDYLQWIEKGREPGKRPPIPAIRNWIEAKGITPRPDEKTGRVPTVDSLAFMIANKISERGFKFGSDPIVEEVVRELNVQYESRIDEAILADVEDEVTIIMKESVW